MRRAQAENVSIMSIEEAEESVEKAKEEWNDIVQHGKEIREKELMDYHNRDIIGDDEATIKKKSKILTGIRRKLKRNHTFNYISRHAGKGIKQKL